MTMGVTVIQLDLTGDFTVNGRHTYDRATGGILAVPYVADEAARLALTPAYGEIVWQEDINVLYRWNGTTWLPSAAASLTFEKSGSLIAGAFTGDPRTAAVSFVTPFADSSYSIAVQVVTSGDHAFLPSVRNRTPLGFEINLNTASNFGLSEVLWSTHPYKDL